MTHTREHVVPRIGPGAGRLSPVSGGAPRGIATLAASFGRIAANLRTVEAENERIDRIKAMQGLDDFANNATVQMEEIKRTTAPGAQDVMERGTAVFDPVASAFLSTVPPRLQPEMTARMNKVRVALASDMRNFDLTQKDEFVKTSIGRSVNRLKPGLADNPAGLEQARFTTFSEISASGLSEVDKTELRQETSAALGEVAYKRYVLDQETGVVTSVGSGINPVQDANGFWQTPGLVYDLGGKTRNRPVTKQYVQRLVGTLQAIDPGLGAVVRSAGQAPEGTGGPRTGSARHDAVHKGASDTSDIVLTADGKQVRPGNNKVLYAKVVKELAAAGFTGMGNYSWGIHVGGGKAVFWGPDGNSATADPLLSAAYKAGRSRQEGGFDFDPIFSDISFERRAVLRAQAKSDAKVLNGNKMRIVSQGIVDDLISRHGNDFAAARKEVREGTSGLLLDTTLTRIDQRRAELAADRNFNREEQDELDLQVVQEKADAIYETTTSKQTAIAEAMKLKGTQRKDVIAQLTQRFDRDANIAAKDLLGDSLKVFDGIRKTTLTEKEALEAVKRIDDPEKRIKVGELVTREYANQDRARSRVVTKAAQERFTRLREAGIPYLDAVAEEQEEANGVVSKEVLRLLDADERRRKTAETQRLKGVESDFYRQLFEGAKFNDVMASLPLDDAKLLQGNRAAIDGLLRAQDTINKGELFTRTSDGKTLAAFRDLTIPEKANVNLDEWRPRLTPPEFERVIVLRDSAKQQLQPNPTRRAVHIRAQTILRTFFPRGRRMGGRQKIAIKQDQQNLLANEMRAFVDSKFEEKKGVAPSEQEIADAAMLLAAPIESDPDGIAIPFIGNPDVAAFEGIVGERLLMSAEQRAVARIDFDSVPAPQLDLIQKAIVEVGLDLNDEDLVENLAGAMAMDDGARIVRLLNR